MADHRLGWGLGAAVLVAIAAYAYRDEIKRPFADDAELVTATAERAASCGSSAARVSVRNGSRRTLRSASIHLAAYERGDSRDLADARIAWTAIVGPGEERSDCFSAPATGDVLEAKLQPWDVVFYGNGDVIPR